MSNDDEVFAYSAVMSGELQAFWKDMSRLQSGQADPEEYDDLEALLSAMPVNGDDLWLGYELPEGATTYQADAQVRVTNPVYPWSTIVFVITRYPDGQTGTGSGVMVGRNDVLTAGHVLYSEKHGGVATSTYVVPFYNPNQPDARPFGDSYGYAMVHPEYPTRGLGRFPYSGDNVAASLAGTEIDWGFISLNRPLGDRTGWMYIDGQFSYGVLNQSGYPRKYGNILTNDTQYAGESSVDNSIDIRNFETHPGNSGGPLWRMGGGQYSQYAFVTGLASTAQLDANGQHTGRGYAAFDTDVFANYFQQMIAYNDYVIGT